MAVLSLRSFGRWGALPGKGPRAEVGVLLGTHATLPQGTLCFSGNSFDV